MSKQQLISVVVTNYNYGKYVSQAINSVFAQTYSNLELIIIDDGSTDNSVEIIEGAIRGHEGVRLIKQSNHGIVYTRNLGIEISKGRYLCFLDADDYWDEDYIENMHNIAIRSGADVVYPNWRMLWHDEKGKYLYTLIPDWEDFNVIDYQLQKMHVSSESLIKKSAIGKHAFKWKAVAEDWEFFTGLALDGRKFVFAKNCFINYRIKPSGRGNVRSETDDIREFVKILMHHKKEYKNTIDPHELVLAKFDEKRQHAVNLEDKIGGLESKIIELEGQLRAAKQKNIEFQESLSWRITMPLREINRWVHERSRKQ